MEHQHDAAVNNGEGSQNGYSVLLNTMNVSFISCLLDRDLTILWANDCFYRQTGYCEEEFRLCFQNIRQYNEPCPETFGTIKNAVEHARGRGETQITVTVRMPRQDGTFLWVRGTGTITDQNLQGYTVFYIICTDISDAVAVAREQKVLYEEEKQYFEWMMDEYVGNVYISDMDTYELLYLNRTACETLGVPPQKLLGRKCYEVIQGRGAPCPFCTNDRLCRDKFYEWEFFNPKLERTFAIKNRVIDWNGRRARIELSHDNYSLEYKLAKKDREREAILRTIPGGLARVDARDMSTILWYSSGFLSLIGYTREQFEKELDSKITYIHPDDRERAASLMEHTMKSGEDAIMEFRIVTRTREQKILTITLSYVSGEESWDGIPSFYSVGIDVTKERREQERQHKALEDAYQAAHVASMAKTNFLSSMSHDIRTPMNAIMGMSVIAKANLSSPDKVNDCLNKINVSSRHLLSLINEVLDMSKIESGKIDLVPENIDLPELVQNVTDMCRPLISEKQQEFKISVDQVHHEKVVADGDRLQQVFMNLLSNAVKYTPEGGSISLVIRERACESPGKGQYEFIFTDNGIGMSREFIPHLFEPFSRAEDSRISKIQGTGLGMAITENIIRMMNGTISVKSRLGEGSCFIVSVPLELGELEEDCEEALKDSSVLVVDDDQMVCENAVALLNELEMRGYWVLSGAEAVCRIAQAHEKGEDFFAVILDWKMPGMDGLETIKAIRKTLGADIPIIIISAYDYSSIEDEFVRAGADAFITKPLFKSKMLHVLQLFCTGSKTESGETRKEAPDALLIGKRVLLAEDNELNREIAVELLQMQGIVVDAVEDGRRAVEVFRASSTGYYGAVLMDIQMPVMDGYGAAAEIRSLTRPDAQTIPILALTANAFAADIGKSHSAGMNDHISKPIDVEHLIETLRKWIK